MLQRKLDRSSPFRSITTFSSAKTNREHYVESKLEMDALLAKEFEEDVLDFSTQEHMEYPRGSKTFRYTADLRVVRKGGLTNLEEIKPQKELRKAAIQEKFNFIQAACLARGEKLEFTTDQDIYVDDLNKNHRLLYRYKCEPLDEALTKQFKTDFPKVNTSFGQLRHELSKKGYPAHFGHTLLAHRIIACDLRKALSFRTEVAHVS